MYISISEEWKRSVSYIWICLNKKFVHLIVTFDGLNYPDVEWELEQRARWEILHRLSKQFYFHRQFYIILQKVTVCNPYKQKIFYSEQGKNRPKVAPGQLQHNRNFTEATATEINHNLVCTFIEESAVYRFCYNPNLTVLKSCMMLSRSSIMVLCFGRDL